MKIRLLDEIPYVEEKIKKGTDGKLYADNIPVDISIKNSKSFVIIKNNVVEYVEKHKMDAGFLQKDDNPLKIYPFADFKIIKLSEDFYNAYMFSQYKIKIDFAGFKNNWHFVDLNCWQKFKLDFYGNYTILNSSNIHQLLYGVFGGLIGALLLQLIAGSPN